MGMHTQLQKVDGGRHRDFKYDCGLGTVAVYRELDVLSPTTKVTHLAFNFKRARIGWDCSARGRAQCQCSYTTYCHNISWGALLLLACCDDLTELKVRSSALYIDNAIAVIPVVPTVYFTRICAIMDTYTTKSPTGSKT